MELQELKNAWQSYDNKLEKSYKLNMHCLELIQVQKAKSKLKLLLLSRLVEIAMLIVVIWYLGSFLYVHLAEMQFAVSAAILMLFFIISLSNCIKQIVVIKEIDYSKSVTDVQRKLTLLRSHIVDYIRLIFLAIPTYPAYLIIACKVLGIFDIVSHFNHNWWISQILFSILLIPLCVWIYMKISYKNMDKKWVRYIIEKSAGNSVTKAMDFIKEIEQFKIDDFENDND